MLKLSIWELVFRTIPEGFVFILAAYAFARIEIEKNRYIISSIILGLSTYLIRILPIHFGVHTMLSIMVIILISASINKIEIRKSVPAALISIIIMFLSEGLNVVLLDKLFNIKIEDFMSEVNLKLIYSAPSLIISAVVIFVLYRIFSRTKRG
jgi:hypothetical protein